jgi:hypothetical protein
MSFIRTLEAIDLLDRPDVNGAMVREAFEKAGIKEIVTKRIEGKTGHTDFIKAVIPGKSGKRAGGKAPTLGIIGRLGGIGARPEVTGLVSDGDGAVAAVATALKMGRMFSIKDRIDGDVIISTHICPNAPTQPHEPVPFMGSPVDMATMNKEEVDPEMDGVLVIDTTRGNRVINHKGFAISPTVKEGYILRVSEDLLSIMEIVTGELPVVFPITIQDITPYGNGLYHLNSILQPSTATSAPCVGVAITAHSAVPGCATGATHATDIDQVVRFNIEVAKAFTGGKCAFHDVKEFELLLDLYGPMSHFQTPGKNGNV